MSGMLQAGVVCVCSGLAVAAGPEAAQQAGWSKLKPDLKQLVAAADDAEKIRVVLVMADQAARRDIAILAMQNDKEARRQAVTELLKETAAASQQGVLNALEDGVDAGQAFAPIKSLWIHNVVVASATPDLVLDLAARDDVAYVALEKRMDRGVFPVEPADPADIGGQEGGPTAALECGVDLMGAPDVWDMGITGNGAVVGIIDTGACITHPDLANQVWFNPNEIPNNGIDDDSNGYVDDINGWNFENNNNNITDLDFSGHGTHTAGTVAGDGTNGNQTGMAPDASMMILKFWNNFAGESSVWEGMQYAVDNGAHVITASLGWPHSQNPDRVTWRNTSENAMAAGVITIFAAGNEGSCCGIDSVRTPGDVPDMITVGATNCNDFLAGFSSQGPVTWQNIAPFNDWPFPPGKLKPTISAPGVDTVSLSANCSGYNTLSGTSMATPHVAGAVALMLEANPDLDHFDVKQILKDTSIDLGVSGADNQFGAGRVDALAAVQAALDDATPCEADFNGDGVFSVLDWLIFITAFQNQDPLADLNNDGVFDVLDIKAFRNAVKDTCL